MEKEQFRGYVHQYIKLISLFLNKKEAQDFPIDEQTIPFFLRLSKYHSLTVVLYKAIIDTKLKIDEKDLKKLEEAYFSNLRKAMAYEKERKELYKYLNENDISFLPLKGIIIKDYYPDPYIREFADNDILYDVNKDTLVKDYFVKRGYEIEEFRRSNHDVYMKKPFYNFEMHRALFGLSVDKKEADYFVDYLNKGLVKDHKELYLKDEDFYLYFTAHSYKHYHNSGCGFRPLIDYYLYLKNKELDFNYINQELEKIGLVDFSNLMRTLPFKLFDQQPLTEEEEDIVLFIASSGTYGTLEHNVAKGIKEKGRFKYYMSRVFPSLAFYKAVYPWAYKCRILIPIAWLCRLFRILFKNPKKARNELKMIRTYKEEEE